MTTSTIVEIYNVLQENVEKVRQIREGARAAVIEYAERHGFQPFVVADIPTDAEVRADYAMLVENYDIASLKYNKASNLFDDFKDNEWH